MRYHQEITFITIAKDGQIHSELEVNSKAPPTDKPLAHKNYGDGEDGFLFKKV